MAQTKNVSRIAFVQTGMILAWKFPDGKIVQFDVEMANAEMRERAMYHGFKQKIADSAALSYKQPDGTWRKPSDAEKRGEMLATIDNLYNAQWLAAREATGGLLYRALQELKPGRFPTVGDFDKYVESKLEVTAPDGSKVTLTKKQVLAMIEAMPGVSEKMAELRAAMVADVDSEEILSDF